MFMENNIASNSEILGVNFLKSKEVATREKILSTSENCFAEASSQFLEFALVAPLNRSSNGNCDSAGETSMRVSAVP